MVSIKNLLKSAGIHHFHIPSALGMDNVAMGWNSTRLLAHGIFAPIDIKVVTIQNIFPFHYVQVLMLFL
jgi:hypothetical protein